MEVAPEGAVMGNIPKPEIIKRCGGSRVAAQYLLFKIFNLCPSVGPPDINIEKFRDFSLGYLKEIVEDDERHPSKYKNLFLGRFIIATPGFPYSVKWARWCLSTDTTDNQIIKNSNPVNIALGFLDKVNILWDTHIILQLGPEIEMSFDSGLPLVELKRQLERRIKFERDEHHVHPKAINYASWIKSIQCYDLEQRGISRKRIFEIVYPQTGERVNPSSTVGDAIFVVDKIIKELLSEKFQF